MDVKYIFVQIHHLSILNKLVFCVALGVLTPWEIPQIEVTALTILRSSTDKFQYLLVYIHNKYLGSTGWDADN